MRRSIFFFQAEDGIRDADVTGVQTCALPISVSAAIARPSGRVSWPFTDFGVATNGACFIIVTLYGYEGLYLQRTISRLTLANGSLGFHPRYGRSAGFASA